MIATPCSYPLDEALTDNHGEKLCCTHHLKISARDLLFYTRPKSRQRKTTSKLHSRHVLSRAHTFMFYTHHNARSTSTLRLHLVIATSAMSQHPVSTLPEKFEMKVVQKKNSARFRGLMSCKRQLVVIMIFF